MARRRRLGSLADIAEEYTTKAFRTLLDEAYREAAQRLGVQAQAHSPYTELGLDPAAPMDLVQAAWRFWAKKYHPDQPGGDVEEFKRKKAAYEAIKMARA